MFFRLSSIKLCKVANKSGHTIKAFLSLQAQKRALSNKNEISVQIRKIHQTFCNQSPMVSPVRCQKLDSKNTPENNNSVLSSLVNSSDNRNNNQLSTHLSAGKKAKQAVKDTGYGLVVLTGGLMLCATTYFLFSELFSRETPSGIYDESSKMCLDNFDVKEALGHPIKVTAESGGRRVFQIKHKFFVENGDLFLVINYYLEGPQNKGTVYCKVKKNQTTGKFEYENIVVKLDYAHRGMKRIDVHQRDI